MKRNHRIPWMSICLLAAVVALILTGPNPGARPNGETAETASAFSVQPYLQNLTSDGVTVMWRTNEPAYGWIEFGRDDSFSQKADRVIDGLRHANTTEHRVRLTGLVPGATYRYRVCFKPIRKFEAYKVDFGDPVQSEAFSFRTLSADESEITCVLFNDLHNNYSLFEQLVGALKDTDYRFSIFNGDCFSDPSSEAVFLKALTTYNAGVSAAARPPLYIRGNHETRGAYARHLKESFDFPEDEFFFAMSAGPVRFLFLDCGEDKPDENKEYSGLIDFSGYRARQRDWLKQEIKSKAFLEAKYRVLIHHIPLYNREDAGISRFSRDAWGAVIESAPFDLAISGHVHRYGFVPARSAGNPFPALIGGGPKPENGTVFILTATQSHLQVKVINSEGTVLERLEIK